jgi:hypothetical protein
VAAAQLGARALVLSVALAAACAPSHAFAQTTPAAGRQAALDFQRNVVRIVPKTPDGQDGPSGFGIVMGERDGKLYIATPDHVVRGSDELGPAPDVIFQTEQGRRYPARRLEELRIPPAQGDLAVVEVARPASFRPASIGIIAAGVVPDAAPVWNIGRGGRWLVPTSPGGFQSLDPQTNHALVEDLPTPPGSSGGAVLTERALLGMTLRDSGAQRLTYVFRADRLVEAFRSWQLPVNFVTRTTTPTAAPPPRSLPEVSVATSPPPPAPPLAARQRPPTQAQAEPARQTASLRAGETCDRLAAQADDPQRPSGTPPVTSEALKANAAEAIGVCRSAADQTPGVPRYGYQLARALLAQGRNDEAFVAARKAAEAGHPRAQVLVAQMHERGSGTGVDYTQARIWYEKAAALGDAEAKRALSRTGQSIGSPFLRPSQR